MTKPPVGPVFVADIDSASTLLSVVVAVVIGTGRTASDFSSGNGTAEIPGLDAVRWSGTNADAPEPATESTPATSEGARIEEFAVPFEVDSGTDSSKVEGTAG